MVRHGRTASNVQQLLHGSTDVPLDNHGVQQAALVADAIAASAAPDFIVCSPLSRAFVTAQAIGGKVGRDVMVIPELSEMHFGALEGITIDRLEAEHPEIATRMLDDSDDDFGWPDGETRRDFHGRVLRVFQSILADHPDQRVVVVAHGGVIGSLLAQIEGVSPNDWRRFPIVNCGICRIWVGPERSTIHSVNDAEHLSSLLDAPVEVDS